MMYPLVCELAGDGICSDNGWWSAFGKKRGKNGRTGPPAHEDLVERDFTAQGPNQLWLTDITEHATGEGKLYVCAVKDVLHPPAESGQFRSRKYLAALRRRHLVGSMGQVGTSADNATMESFFTLLQNNVLDRRRWATRQDLRIGIVTWLERTYHRPRRQDRLGRLTPIEYEATMAKAGPRQPDPPVTYPCSSPDGRCDAVWLGTEEVKREVASSGVARRWRHGKIRSRRG